MVMQMLRELPRSWRLMLLTFSSAVSIYQLANSALVTADMVSGEWQGSASRQKSSQLPIGNSEPLHVAALQSCQDAAEQIINSWRWSLHQSCCVPLSLLLPKLAVYSTHKAIIVEDVQSRHDSACLSSQASPNKQTLQAISALWQKHMQN